MLPPVLRSLMNPHHGTQHLQFPNGRPSWVDPEPRIRDEHIASRVLDAEEDLDSTGGLVVGAEPRERFRTGCDSSEAHLAAPDAHASLADGPKPLAREHAEISLLRPTLNFRRTDLPLHPLNPTPPRDERLHARDQFDGLFRGHRRIATGSPESVQRRPRQDQRRIDLEKIRTIVRIVEQGPERFEVAIAIRNREPRHHVRADFQPGGLRSANCGPALGIRVAAVHRLEDIVVGRLDSKFHAGRAEREARVDLRPEEAVGLRLNREADAPGRSGLIRGLRRPNRIRDKPVHRVETSFHEPFLVPAVERGEGPSQDNQIDLVRGVTDFLERPEPGDELRARIVAVSRRASRRRFRADGRLWRTELWSTWREGARAVRAGVRRGHHGRGGDAARGASGLDPQKIIPFTADRRRAARAMTPVSRTWRSANTAIGLNAAPSQSRKRPNSNTPRMPTPATPKAMPRIPAFDTPAARFARQSAATRPPKNRS